MDCYHVALLHYEFQNIPAVFNSKIQIEGLDMGSVSVMFVINGHRVKTTCSDCRRQYATSRAQLQKQRILVTFPVSNLSINISFLAHASRASFIASGKL